jgi:hypothetical protein
MPTMEKPAATLADALAACEAVARDERRGLVDAGRQPGPQAGDRGRGPVDTTAKGLCV